MQKGQFNEQSAFGQTERNPSPSTEDNAGKI